MIPLLLALALGAKAPHGSLAAERLGISYKALLYKLKQIGYGEYEAS